MKNIATRIARKHVLALGLHFKETILDTEAARTEAHLKAVLGE